MAKLGILIAHYKEPLEMLKVMLNSINKQNIDSSQIKVHILNDGDEVTFKKSDFDDYNYEIEYSITERCGTSKMRNKLLSIANEKYIWFLDCDDYLIDNSLQSVMDELNDNPGIDLILAAALWENKKHQAIKFAPDYYSYSLLGCSIIRKQFLIDNNIYSDESVFLAGDIVIENLPKYYTNKRKRLTTPVLFYRYEPKSAVHDGKNNGWREESQIVTCHMISKLLSDNKIREAYNEYLRYVLRYNSKKVHNTFVDKFKELGLYHIDYRLDLRDNI